MQYNRIKTVIFDCDAPHELFDNANIIRKGYLCRTQSITFDIAPIFIDDGL